MTYEEILPTLRRFLGAFEAFRRLGFESSAIFLLIARSATTRNLAVFAHLRTDSGTFSCEAGDLEVSQAEYGAEYKRVVDLVIAGKVPQAVLDRIWEESPIRQNAVGFVLSLREKGIVPPEERVDWYSEKKENIPS